MKYVIVQLSGKQYLLEENSWYDIDFINRNKEDLYLSLDKILMYKNNSRVQIGKPFLKNSSICATIVGDISGKKLTVLKTKPKKKYTRVKGHKQIYTRIFL